MPNWRPHGFVTHWRKIAKLSIWIYPYPENHNAKNVITREYKDVGVFKWISNLYYVILKNHLTMPPIRPFRAFLFGFLHFSGSYFSSPGGYDVDFYLPATRQYIQVTQNLNNASTREREVRALQDAIQVLKPKEALILTDANRKDFQVAEVPVRIRSVAEWMLNP